MVISIKISDEAHAKLKKDYRLGKSFADMIDELLGITASNTRKGGRK